MISADELFSKGGCCLTREATRARCRGVLPLLETSFLWRIERTTCRFIGRRRGHRRGGRGFWGGRGLRTLGPRKLRENSDGSFVRKSAASMLSGKRPVQAVPAKQKVGSGKSGGSKKGEVTVQSKASKSVEPPEDVEPAEMSLEEIESKLGSLIKADTISQLKSTVWKERLEVGSAEYIEEPATKVRFQTSLSLPGCSSSLALLGTGYREKVFAIIGVKVYAAGLYVNQSILNNLNAWKGRSAAVIQRDPSLFSSIFQSPFEKSLQIILVRNVDGKTFWNALNDAISPRIKSPTSVDESALSTFRSTFERQPLKKGTFIFLTWPQTSKMLVSISSNGLPSSVDATIESENVSSALFEVFFGDTPVSPPLKASVATGLESILK